MSDRIFIGKDEFGFLQIHQEPGEGREEYASMTYAEQLKKLAEADVLNWAMRLCFSGQTPMMIRKQLWDRWQALTGGK